MRGMPVSSPVRVAVVDDHQIVVSGLAAMLAPYRDRVSVLELDPRKPTTPDLDVVLYDPFAKDQRRPVDTDCLTHGGAARLVVFSWHLDPEHVVAVMGAGASGYLSKGTTPVEMVEALESIRRGQTVVPAPPAEPDGGLWRWIGREHGLSARESEVLTLIVQGLSNQEIADRSYLSINSVKTYIRTAYRKIGVSRRAQAVVWGMNHGFHPDRLREVGR